MSNAFGNLLNLFRIEKRRVVEDMTFNLLLKHSGYNRDEILVNELNLPDGKMVVRVSLRRGFDEIDWQTATLTPAIETNIIREANLPEYHPNHPDYANYKKPQENTNETPKTESDW